MNDATRLAALLLEDEGAWDFTSVMDSKYVSITGEPENWELQSLKCVVKWTLEFEARSWGVKEFNPIIRHIEIIANFDIIDPETGDASGGETVELTYPSQAPAQPTDDVKSSIDHYAGHVDAEAQWQTRSHEEYSPSVFPKDVEIDLSTNHIIVFF